MRALRVLAVGAALLAGGCRARDFQLSGTVTLAARLQNKLPRANAVLFIIAKNDGKVPIAVRRIVNPQFPVIFSLKDEDLIVPGTAPEGPLSLEAQMNTHGNVGSPARGDLEGGARDPVHSGARGIRVVIDREV